MTSTELENLVRIGKLKREPPAEHELTGLLASGQRRLEHDEHLLVDMLAAAKFLLGAVKNLPED